MQFNDSDSERFLIGLQPTVTENGACSDGCFGYGELSKTGEYRNLNNILFKAVMDNVHYYDISQNYPNIGNDGVYWIQGSYDLNFTHPCAHEDTQECMIAIDGISGTMLSAKEANNFTLYGVQPPPSISTTRKKNVETDTTVMAFVDGFEDECKHYYNNYAFATVDLMEPSATLVSCLQNGITIEDTEYTAFNKDGSMFANAVGDDETETQVLIFNTTNGRVIVNSDLDGLGRLLLAYADIYVIWGITF